MTFIPCRMGSVRNWSMARFITWHRQAENIKRSLENFLASSGNTSNQKTVHAEHREMLQKIKDRDKEGIKELVLRHLANLIDFAKMSAKGNIPEFEYGHI